VDYVAKIVKTLHRGEFKEKSKTKNIYEIRRDVAEDMKQHLLSLSQDKEESSGCKSLTELQSGM